MVDPENRWAQFTLWSIFVLTTVAAVLAAACTGAFGQTTRTISLRVLSGACFATLAVIVIVPPCLFLVVV